MATGAPRCGCGPRARHSAWRRSRSPTAASGSRPRTVRTCSRCSSACTSARPTKARASASPSAARSSSGTVDGSGSTGVRAAAPFSASPCLPGNTAVMSDVAMPRLSDSMEEGTILKWLKSDGDEVSKGEELVEIETDKANMTYEADEAGTLEIVAQEGDT